MYKQEVYKDVGEYSVTGSRKSTNIAVSADCASVLAISESYN